MEKCVWKNQVCVDNLYGSSFDSCLNKSKEDCVDDCYYKNSINHCINTKYKLCEDLTKDECKSEKICYFDDKYENKCKVVPNIKNMVYNNKFNTNKINRLKNELNESIDNLGEITGNNYINMMARKDALTINKYLDL